jgi:hypothetical protein
MAASKDRQITIRFEKDLFDLLSACAEDDDRSVASLVRHLARRHVERHGKNPSHDMERSSQVVHQPDGGLSSK